MHLEFMSFMTTMLIDGLVHVARGSYARRVRRITALDGLAGAYPVKSMTAMRRSDRKAVWTISERLS